MKEKAKELLLKKDFRNAFDVAEKCDQDDPEILYIKGRCLEEGVKRFRHGGLGAWHDFFAGDAGSHEALECYRNAYQKDKNGNIEKLIKDQKKKYIAKHITRGMLWPAGYILTKQWENEPCNIIFIGLPATLNFVLISWLTGWNIVGIITAFFIAYLTAGAICIIALLSFWKFDYRNGSEHKDDIS